MLRPSGIGSIARTRSARQYAIGLAVCYVMALICGRASHAMFAGLHVRRPLSKTRMQVPWSYVQTTIMIIMLLHSL